MYTNFYGIGNNNSFFDTFFGAGSSGGSSISSMSSMLGDLAMIQRGTYKKALKSLYAAQKAANTETDTDTNKKSVSKLQTADSNNNLSLVKSSAKALNESAKVLQNEKYDTVKREDLLKDVKNFVSDYNDTLSATKKINSFSMLQTAVWTTDQMNISEGLLNKVGISIKEDNTLAVDEEKFNKASNSDLKALFSGSSSLASRISQKASTLYNQSTNQMAVSQGRFAYTSFGTLF